MPTRRMLHTKISNSIQVDRLPLPARLLFTWLIAHGDDDGRISGNPKYIKGTVVPYTNWSSKKIKKYLELMHEQRLIYYWEQNNEWFIEFVKWKNHQTLKNDRYHASPLPSYPYKNDHEEVPSRIHNVSTKESKPTITESNETKSNKSEGEKVADKKSREKDPYQYNIKNDDELAAFEAWKKLEPDNPKAFYTTYLLACLKGLKASTIYQFVAEINQDTKAKKKGAVFNAKMKEYLNAKNK